MGGAHQEVRDDRGLLGGAQVRERRILIDALAHECGDARDLRGRHRGAGHGPVLAPQDGGHDGTAGGGDLGLESQVGGDAPGREVRDRGVGGGQREAGVRVRDGDGVGVGGVDGRDQRVLLLLRDGHGRQRVGRLDRRHVGGVRVLGVSDDEGGGRGAQLGERADLGLVRHVGPGRAVRPAAVLQDDDGGEVAGVLSGEFVEGRAVTDTGINEGVCPLGDVEQAGDDSVLEAARLAVDDLLVTVGEVGQGVLVVHRCNRQGRGVGGGFRDCTRVRVARVRLILPALVVISTRI